jgi:transketolase
MADRSKEETRDRFGETLVDLAKQFNDIIAMDCDLGRSTRSFRITEADPGRFIEMGIAEQNMISTAAGMASVGKVVFVNSFAVFITGRCFDQIRQQVALPKLNVKICGSSGGITLGPDGATHQSVVDIALMRSLPNMTVIVPADGNQTEQVVRSAYKYKGPVYMRLSRYPIGEIFASGGDFVIGKGNVIRKGKKVAFVSCGPVLKNVIEAADILETAHINAGIVNLPTVKPIDSELLSALAGDYEFFVTVEEHSIIGGLGSAVAECICAPGFSRGMPRLLRLGVQDAFGESGNADELLHKHSLDAQGIAHSVIKTMKTK